jgi:eukaryotic-like serine/threonine-protein kinase
MQDPTASPVSPVSDPDDPLIGTIIGDRYRVEKELGSGGMGTVYCAEHVMMEKRVALKVLHPNLAVVGSVMDRFQREAVALSRIEHPNVVSATDFGKLKNGSYYLALEYVDGHNLAEALQKEGRFDVKRALAISEQIAQALVAAHGHGIVHRDLKPHNVMLSGTVGSETVKVLDFGLAKLRSKTIEGSTANIGAVFGTPHYMAPEQVASTNVDGRADIYSLGIMLYEMLSGRRPFDADSPNVVLDLQMSQPPPPLPEHLPDDVRALVGHLLQKLPEHRPTDAKQVVLRLHELIHPTPPEPPPTLTWQEWLQQEVAVAALTLPRWALLLPAIVFVAILTLGFLISPDDGPSAANSSQTLALESANAEPAASPVPPSAAPATTQWPQLVSLAEFGDVEALKQLRAIPNPQRSREVWLVIGQGLVKAGNGLDALHEYEQASKHKPEVKSDAAFTKVIRELASNNDSSIALAALNLAALSFGSRGVDILFSVWSETKERTPATALAERYLAQDSILKGASPPVQIALALRNPDLSCDTAKALLEQAKKDADTRSLRPMARFRRVRGCGPNKRSDCFLCIRDSELLEEAVREANSREAPRY